MKSYLHPDALGSVVAVSSATGAVSEKHGYGPFGETDATAGSAFRYTCQRLDAESGLGFYRARMYSANIGRFLSPDPIGYADGPNVYAYVPQLPSLMGSKNPLPEAVKVSILSSTFFILSLIIFFCFSFSAVLSLL